MRNKINILKVVSNSSRAC